MSIPKVISLTYELRSGGSEGDVIEIADHANPAEFLFGVGNLVPEFEENINPLKVGDNFEFTITAENAYGVTDPNSIVNLPRNIFNIDGKEDSEMLVVGNVVPMRDQNGHALQGTVLEILDESVKMDFNHPLAGHDLHFRGKILSTRAATPEEIDHKHVHTGYGGH